MTDSASSHEYTPNNPALMTSPSSMYSGKLSGSPTIPTNPDLTDPLLCGNSSSRYPDNSYYPNNWSSNPGYSNNYNYYNTPSNNQNQYIQPSGPTMVLYPHLYSTVNQNQIHLHLHGSPEKLDQYFNLETLSVSSAPRSGNELPTSSSIEVGSGHLTEGDRKYEESTTADPASVWRPY